MPRKALTTRQRAIKAGYRSGLEEQTAIYLKKKGVAFTYEEQKIKWDDFNGIIIETKGRFTATDRMKHLSIRKQYGTEHDIRFVFSNSRSKLYKGAKSSYGDWCKKHGFKYADKEIPKEWLRE